MKTKEQLTAEIRAVEQQFQAGTQYPLIDRHMWTRLCGRLVALEAECDRLRRELDCEERRFNAQTDLLHEVSQRAERYRETLDELRRELGALVGNLTKQVATISDEIDEFPYEADELESRSDALAYVANRIAAILERNGGNGDE